MGWKLQPGPHRDPPSPGRPGPHAPRPHRHSPHESADSRRHPRGGAWLPSLGLSAFSKSAWPMAPEGELRPPPAGRSRESRPCAHPPWGREWRASGRAQLGSIQPDLGLGSRCATQAGYSGSLGLISFICKTGPIKCPPECQQPLPGCPPRTWAWERDTGRFHSEAAVVLPRQGPSEAGHLFLAPNFHLNLEMAPKALWVRPSIASVGFRFGGGQAGPLTVQGGRQWPRGMPWSEACQTLYLISLHFGHCQVTMS